MIIFSLLSKELSIFVFIVSDTNFFYGTWKETVVTHDFFRVSLYEKEISMKKMALSFLILFTVFTQAFGSDKISKTLIKEWNTFRTQVDSIEPHGDIGGYMLYRDYQDMTLLWRTSSDVSENEVIRFFMERSNGSNFVVTYHKSNIIVPGRIVLRRFVGTEPTGWINHTIDFTTGEYLGSQGQATEIMSNEKRMMKEWGIQPL